MASKYFVALLLPIPGCRATIKITFRPIFLLTTDWSAEWKINADDKEKAKQIGYTLEPRPTKGKGPIPLGTYKYSRWMSKRLKKTLRLYDVKGFSDILVHVGNKERDTVGCILVGKKLKETRDVGPQALLNSRTLIDWLYDNCHEGTIKVVELTDLDI